MSERVVSELRKLATILSLGMIYYFIVILTGFSIPCMFYKITGYLCPSCGITRMIKSLLVLDFQSAYSYNKCLFITWPLIVIPFIFSEVKYIKTGHRNIGKLNILLFMEIAILIIFGIIRNIQ